MRVLSIVFIFLLLGCTSRYSAFKSTTPSQREVFLEEPPKITLVLGAGGNKGVAHIAVLQELEQLGVKPNLIIGCSAGSLIGAFYSYFQDSEKVKNIFFSVKTKDFYRQNLTYLPYGLASLSNMKRFINKNLPAHSFSQLKIPLVTVATDLVSGKLVPFSQGDLVSAVLASACIPGVFTPLTSGEHLFVDGAVVDPLPTALAKKLQSELVIAVDLSGSIPASLPTNALGVIKRSWEISYQSLSERSAEFADLVIKPEFNINNFTMFSDRYAQEVFDAGLKAVRKQVPTLKRLLKKNLKAVQ